MPNTPKVYDGNQRSHLGQADAAAGPWNRTGELEHLVSGWAQERVRAASGLAELASVQRDVDLLAGIARGSNQGGAEIERHVSGRGSEEAPVRLLDLTSGLRSRILAAATERALARVYGHRVETTDVGPKGLDFSEAIEAVRRLRPVIGACLARMREGQLRAS